MSGRLKWDQTGEKLYETGVDRGVVYPMSGGTYGDGVAWNGLSAVSENPSGGEPTAIYADNAKYLNLLSKEDYGLSVEAYTYPDEFAACDGSADVTAGVRFGQQKRKQFGFSYRTLVGNDEDGEDYGYKIHLVYNCTAAPSEKSHSTVNDSPEAMSFSWDFSTTPVEITTKDSNDKPYKPVAHIEIDSTKFTSTADKEKLAALEDMLYGTDAVAASQGVEAHDATAAKLPTPDEVITLFSAG